MQGARARVREQLWVKVGEDQETATTGGDSPVRPPLQPHSAIALTPFLTASPARKDAFSRLPPRLALRVVLAALALFLVFHFTGPILFGDLLSSSQKLRKERMAGAGESWILPARWREANVEAGEGEVTLGGETLPECKRVMLFRFSK